MFKLMRGKHCGLYAHLCVDGSETIGQCLDSSIGRCTAIPSLFRPPFWHILKLVCLAVVPSTDDARDGLVVGNTTSAIGSVGEEVGIKGERTEAHDRWKWEVIEVRVIRLAELGIGEVLVPHGCQAKVFTGSSQRDVLLEES